MARMTASMTSLPVGARTHPVPAAPLVARTVGVDPDVAADLLALLPPGPTGGVCSWVRRGEGLVGWGRAASFTASGPDRFATLEGW